MKVANVCAAASLIVCFAVTTSCATEQLGAVLGRVAGSQIGSGEASNVFGTLGAVAGSYFGAEVARALTDDDKSKIDEATVASLNAAEETVETDWSNDESGNSGSVSVQAVEVAESDGDQKLCREFKQSVTLADGTKDEAIGRACQQADGSWTLEA